MFDGSLLKPGETNRDLRARVTRTMKFQSRKYLISRSSRVPTALAVCAKRREETKGMAAVSRANKWNDVGLSATPLVGSYLIDVIGLKFGDAPLSPRQSVADATGFRIRIRLERGREMSSGFRVPAELPAALASNRRQVLRPSLTGRFYARERFTLSRERIMPV